MHQRFKNANLVDYNKLASHVKTGSCHCQSSDSLIAAATGMLGCLMACAERCPSDADGRVTLMQASFKTVGGGTGAIHFDDVE